MKAKRFLKRTGIYAVPVITTIIVLLLFNAMLQWTFDVSHPDELSQLFFTIGKQAVSHVIVGFVVAIWIFACTMRWAKEKDLRMRAKVLGVDYDELAADAKRNAAGYATGNKSADAPDNKPADDEGDGTGVQVRTATFSSGITVNVQKWLKCTRYLACATCECLVVGNVHLDIPTEDEREKDDFWKKCDAFIYALWVAEAYRNHHIATRLLDMVEHNAKVQGCKTVALEWDIREAEEWTLKWYLHRGYEEKEFGNGTSFLVKDLAWNEEEPDEQPAQDENHDENHDDNE